MVAALAQLMVLIDATAFNMAVPSVQADLGIPLSGLSVMSTVYVLAFGGLMLLGGHITDLAGRRLTLIIGLAGFAVASALGGSAADSSMLIWARALQGAFGAVLTPAALALVTTGFTDPKERGRAFGVYAVISGGGSALGLLMGGWLVENLTWRLSLYAAVPLAVAALIGALTLPHDRPGRTGARFDALGVLLGTGGLAALTYGLIEAEPRDRTDPLILVLLAAGVVLLVAYLWRRTTTSRPSLSPSTVEDRDRIGCFLVMLLAGLGVTASFATLDFYLRNVLGYSPAAAGVAFLPMVAALVIGATQVAARLLPRVAPRILIVAGLATAALGLLLLTGLETDGAYATQALPGMVLTGFGTGLAFMPVFATATAAVAPEHSGAASATITAAQHVGGAIGVALLTGALAVRLRPGASWSPEQLAGELLGRHTGTLWWAVGGMLLAGLLAGLLVTAKSPGGDGPPVHTAG
ncbi:MFS transporter [Streptomyces sp. NBC_01433]|nr:MFS transporter [Streptomyces sp. NBC_01433]